MTLNVEGTPKGGNPDGSSSWAGKVRALYVHPPHSLGKDLQGDARFEFDAVAQTMDIEITNLIYNTYNPPWPDMSWDDLPVINGEFQDATIEGRFYGNAYQGVAAVVENDSLRGVIGAIRE